MAEPDSVAVRAASGSAVLSVGSFAYAAISAVGSIVVARLLGPADYGAVSMALIYPMMFSGLADLGLSTAVMRFAALGDAARVRATAPRLGLGLAALSLSLEPALLPVRFLCFCRALAGSFRAGRSSSSRLNGAR